MKATLEYDLTDYSEKLMHRKAVNAENAYMALSDIQDMLMKARESYDSYDPTSTEMEDLTAEFSEILYKYHINLDEDIE